MRKFLMLFLLLSVVGCSTARIPRYVPDNNPYTKIIYADFDAVFQNSIQILEDLDWAIETTQDPGVFEREHAVNVTGKQVVIFTKTRNVALVVASRYARLNVIITESEENVTDLEFRYIGVDSLPIKSHYTYKNDTLAEKFFSRLEMSFVEPLDSSESK